MTKSSMIRARIEPELKEEVESVFKKLGLSTTEAISLFYTQVKLQQGLPFEVKIPNKETLKTFKKTDLEQELIYCDNPNDMFEKLGI